MKRIHILAFALAIFTLLSSLNCLIMPAAAEDAGTGGLRITSHSDDDVIDRSANSLTISCNVVPGAVKYTFVIKHEDTDSKVYENSVRSNTITINPRDYLTVDGTYKIYVGAFSDWNHSGTLTMNGGTCWHAVYVQVCEQNSDDYTVYLQKDERWADHPYGYSDANATRVATIQSSGCGVLALTNAVSFLTGEFIDPKVIADYSVSKGHRLNGVGTKASLYSAFGSDFGYDYGFSYGGYCDRDLVENMQEALQAGEVIIVSVPNHLMAIVDYDQSNNTFLVLDSAPSLSRWTSAYGDWIHADEFTEGSLRAKYFVSLTSYTESDSEHEEDDEEETPQGELKFSVPSITGKPGETIDIPVYITANSGVAYLQFQVETELSFSIKAGEVLTQHYIESDRAIFYQGLNSYLTGVLAHIVVEIPDNVIDGQEFSVAITFSDCYDIDEKTVFVNPMLITSIKVEKSIPGDINNDDTIDGRDLLSLLKLLSSTEISNETTADVNEDGQLNGADVLRLLKILAAN